DVSLLEGGVLLTQLLHAFRRFVDILLLSKSHHRRRHTKGKDSYVAEANVSGGERDTDDAEGHVMGRQPDVVAPDGGEGLPLPQIERGHCEGKIENESDNRYGNRGWDKLQLNFHGVDFGKETVDLGGNKTNDDEPGRVA